MPWQAYHTVWALLIFGWICNYVVRMAFSPLLEPVMAEFGLSHAQGGFLFSVFFYGYVAMQVPAGLLGDRFGRKRVLVIGILLVSGAALVTGLSGTLAVLALARLLTGLAQGMYFANDRPIIAAATPPDRLALGQGVSFSGLGVGTALGVLVGGALGELMPWRQVFLVLMVLPLCSAALVGRFVPDPGRGGQGSLGARASRAEVAAVFRLRDLWLLGIAGISPIWTQWLVGTWGPALFAEVGIRELGRSGLLRDRPRDRRAARPARRGRAVRPPAAAPRNAAPHRRRRRDRGHGRARRMHGVDRAGAGAGLAPRRRDVRHELLLLGDVGAGLRAHGRAGPAAGDGRRLRGPEQRRVHREPRRPLRHGLDQGLVRLLRGGMLPGGVPRHRWPCRSRSL